jgi:hypothetical protein
MWQQGLMAEESAQLLRDFFKSRRGSKAQRVPAE